MSQESVPQHSVQAPDALVPTQDFQHKAQIVQWLKLDCQRWFSLLVACEVANRFAVSDYWLAAGFVRNLVWDHLHQLPKQPLSDIDFVFFDNTRTDIAFEREIEAALMASAPDLPWSVKNQARMHLRNDDRPYTSVVDAMGFWPEQETAVGVKLVTVGKLDIVSAFGLNTLFSCQLTPNPQRSLSVFDRRVRDKGWLTTYPKLHIVKEGTV